MNRERRAQIVPLRYGSDRLHTYMEDERQRNQRRRASRRRQAHHAARHKGQEHRA